MVVVDLVQVSAVENVPAYNELLSLPYVVDMRKVPTVKRLIF